ncbi:hypothetical protein PVK06_000101 [Gossypium arboreum]|uniref:RNase H type-1 domain-containing protein n=1 Tax=Gossypium arboreum TaxID=29729 RepID=A0ABR0QY96_GOSAR|nr:hypothetical protein PVK06_000101 [Gossypium arboreum]
MFAGVDLTTVEVEGDMIGKLQKEKIERSEIALESRVFKHVPRQANSAAHVLATEGLKREEALYLIGDVPLYAKRKVEDDERWLALSTTADGRRLDPFFQRAVG